jgi:hypothetical protein
MPELHTESADEPKLHVLMGIDFSSANFTTRALKLQ